MHAICQLRDVSRRLCGVCNLGWLDSPDSALEIAETAPQRAQQSNVGIKWQHATDDCIR